MARLVQDKMHLTEKENFIATRKGILRPEELSLEERNELIKKQPAYGNIICRCEMISEGEILDAIHRPLGARSLDAIKRRTRAGMVAVRQVFVPAYHGNSCQRSSYGK